jgi:class 3 adenylate cyclase
MRWDSLGRMVSCAACGQENPQAARFCYACGSAIDSGGTVSRDERRLVTVLFVDLVGFTSRAEQLDPEDVRAIQRPYHDRVRQEVESFGGVIEKFIGDAVVGVFGAPTAFGDDPERAVRAALAVRSAIAEMNGENEALDLHVRIGVNTGDALVAIGSRPDLGEGMVSGDVVNTAARLQQNAPADGILVGGETYAATRRSISYSPSAAISAKGKADPVEAWLALSADRDRGESASAAVPMVGRAGEMDLLRGIWERVASSATPHLVTVLAPPGVGKTRLSVEFARSVRESGGHVIRGRSLPYRDSGAYGAFAAQVKQLAGIFESDTVPVGRRKLRETVERVGVDSDAVATHLGILLGLEHDETVDDWETLFFSVCRFVETIAQGRPTMLVFEDLHWADASLLDLVELLASRLRRVPILLLSLARPELLDARPTWGGGLPAYTSLPLEALSAGESCSLAFELLGTRSSAARDDIAAYVAATAEGNPLFIEELAAVASERHAPLPESLPTTIRGIVAARLDALPQDERAVMLDAAVVGKVFWRGALSCLSEDPGRLREVLGALEQRDLIRREHASAIEGDQQFAFKHVLIRDVAYEVLPRAERLRRHEGVARFLEQETPEVGEAAAQLAHHWRAAGRNDRAITYALAAAEHAGRGWAKQRAFDLYQESLALVPDEDGDLRREIRRRLALAYETSWHVADVRGQRVGQDATDPS